LKCKIFLFFVFVVIGGESCCWLAMITTHVVITGLAEKSKFFYYKKIANSPRELTPVFCLFFSFFTAALLLITTNF